MVKEYLNLREIANAEFRAGRLGAALAIYTQALQKATKDSERALILANRRDMLNLYNLRHPVLGSDADKPLSYALL